MSQEIPHSNLSFETLNINMGPVKGKPSVVYNYDGNILLAVDNETKFLMVDINFDPLKLESKDRETTFRAVNVWLRNDNTTILQYKKLPNWVKNFKSIKTLLLDVEIDELTSIKDVRIDNIIFQKGHSNNMINFLEQLSFHKEIKSIAHSNFFTDNQVAELKKSIPGLEIISNDEFTRKIKDADSAFLDKWF